MDPGPDSTNPVLFSPDDRETIYLLTSLTAGSSTIITATSRLEHLLKSNKVPFKAVDLATDDKARSLWSRRGGGKRLPGIVKDGLVLGNYEDCEEWNEYGELKQNLGIKPKKKKKKAAEDPASPTAKRVTDLSGTPSSAIPMTTSSPNIVPEDTTPVVGNVQAAALAAAAAAAVKNLKKTGSIRSVASKKEGGERPVTPIAAVIGAKDVKEEVIVEAPATESQATPENVEEQKPENKDEEKAGMQADDSSENNAGEKTGDGTEDQVEARIEETKEKAEYKDDDNTVANVEEQIEEKAEDQAEIIVDKIELAQEKKEESAPETIAVTTIITEKVEEPEEEIEDSLEIAVLAAATAAALERVEREEDVEEEPSAVEANVETTAAIDPVEEEPVVATAIAVEVLEQGEVEEVRVVERKEDEKIDYQKQLVEKEGDEKEDMESEQASGREAAEPEATETDVAPAVSPGTAEKKVDQAENEDDDILAAVLGVTTATTVTKVDKEEIKKTHEDVVEEKKDIEVTVEEPEVESVIEEQKEEKVAEKVGNVAIVEEAKEKKEEKVEETGGAIITIVNKVEKKETPLPTVTVEKADDKNVDAEKERKVIFEEAQKKLEGGPSKVDEKPENDKEDEDGEK